MKSLILVLVICSSAIKAEELVGNYQLKSSNVKYLVNYLIKKAEAESTASKGKGECKNAVCDFLVAAPVKTFESKDSNRDLNMLGTVKADKFPLVAVKVKTKSDISSGKMVADLEVDFAGVKKNYPGIVFNVKKSASGFDVDGKFDLLLTPHQIEKPTLLGVAIEEIVPMTINASWVKI